MLPEGGRETEEGGRGTEERDECGSHPFNPSLDTAAHNGCDEPGRNRGRPPRLDKEAVFEWFGLHLSPARRLEFMCGLLHMCQPLELRFLGACLEDLARKDFHVLRDFESRANSPGDLGLLMDVTDPVVLSRLLVYLSLLGSKSRECAGILYRTLGRIDVYHLRNCSSGLLRPHGVPRHHPAHRGEGGTEPAGSDLASEPVFLEQLALLFTMASLHPAFTFHQREVVRTQLENVEVLLEERRTTGPSTLDQVSRPDYLCPHADGSRTWPSCTGPVRHLNSTPQRQVVHIEKVTLKEISPGADCRQFSFEVQWSDSTSTNVSKSHRELQEFVVKLCKEQGTEGLLQGIVGLLSQPDGDPRALERELREMFWSMSPGFLQTCQLSGFFLPQTTSLHCSHCNNTPGPRTRQPAPRFSEDCSETSSLEEDIEAYRLSCSRSHSVRNAGYGRAHPAGSPRESGRRNAHVELNGDVTGRRRGSPQCGTDPEQEYDNPVACVSAQNSAEERTAPKTKGRTPGKRDRSRRGPAGRGSVANGILRTPAVQMMGQAACKAPGRDVYGDTSSESSNSVPSSPVHHQPPDTESQSDNSTQEPAGKPHLPKSLGRKAVAMVNPLKAEPERAGFEVTKPSSAVVELALSSCLPYALKYSPAPREAGRADESKLTITIPLAKQDRRVGRPASRDPVEPPAVPHTQQLPLGAISVLSPSQCPPPAGPEQSQAPPPATPTGKPCPKTATQPLPPPHPPGTAPSQGPPPVGVPVQTPAPCLPPPTAALSHNATQNEPTPAYGTGCAGPITAQSQPAAQQQQAGCNTCGCRGSCGGGNAHQSPGFYLPAHTARQVFGPPAPFFHVAPSLGAAPFPGPAHQTNGAPLSFYTHASPAFAAGALLHPHTDHLLAAQPGYGLAQPGPFGRFYPPVFQPAGMVPKKPGAGSCYNCGMSGHYAQDCKQPSMDAGQPGGFRLKYVVPHSSETLDKPD
ncbi:zinc finger CCHC domain-containing protein 2 isoform X2 [Brachyhypopomus gauderio]|uniref:zinc finger CCHC domain-containing protein 2 isoform X2 n=1 Tax=Brachyhypopomus gauderio TaxID=698409 RepID=UPI00404305BD